MLAPGWSMVVMALRQELGDGIGREDGQRGD